VLGRPAERILRFIGAAELVEDQTLMDQGLDVLRIELERPAELAQGPVGLAEQGERHAEKVVHVRECASRVDN
jgi:hypothetical protein